MMGVKKVLAAAGAVAMIAGASVVLAAPAQAAPSVTVTPNSNLKGGQVVTVTYSGYSPNGPIAVGVCPTPRINKITGPGDCGRSKNGASKLTTADASGKGTAQITIPQGALENATPPAAKCPPCSIGVTNIAKTTETANVKLNYRSDDNNKPILPEPGLPVTGPRETAIIAVLGFVLVQIGLVFAVRASRSAPRRTVV